MKNAILTITYKGKEYPQGKYFQDWLTRKHYFVVNIDKEKWWNNYGGYSISKEVLDAFSFFHLRCRILYVEKKKGIMYEANSTAFYTCGILVPYGNHEQYVLPIKHWKSSNLNLRSIHEPFQLKNMKLRDWRITPSYYKFIRNTAVPVWK
jgi:hypothetical protein